jgi:hypothetical protein
VAQVLQAREHCTPTECPMFRSLTDNHQIITNMDEHRYEGLVSRYAALWTVQPAATTAALPPGMAALAAYPSSVPTGRPTNADFPSAASTPPVSIMTPEPALGTSRAASAPANAAAPAVRPSPHPSSTPAVASAKKPTPKPHPVPAPTLISPTPSSPAGSSD